jgi:hypothetical protein
MGQRRRCRLELLYESDCLGGTRDLLAGYFEQSANIVSSADRAFFSELLQKRSGRLTIIEQEAVERFRAGRSQPTILERQFLSDICQRKAKNDSRGRPPFALETSPRLVEHPEVISSGYKKGAARKSLRDATIEIDERKRRLGAAAKKRGVAAQILAEVAAEMGLASRDDIEKLLKRPRNVRFR